VKEKRPEIVPGVKWQHPVTLTIEQAKMLDTASKYSGIPHMMLTLDHAWIICQQKKAFEMMLAYRPNSWQMMAGLL